MASGADETVFEQVKQEYMAPIFEEIRADAERRACGGVLRSIDAFRAFEEYFSGLSGRRRGFGGFVEENIFLIAATLLTILFGAFGLYHPDDQDVASFLDIAKIFAGAVVGGAAGSSVASIARRKKRG